MLLREPVLYSTAGLAIRSQLWLPARPKRDQRAPHDVDVVFGAAQAIAPVVPSDQVLADLVVDGVPQYTFCRLGEGFVGRFYGLADFEIAGGLDGVVCHPVMAGPSQDVPIVMAGAVASFLAAMRGRFILHASAVEVGGGAVAFVGDRGQGKTTMAALFCLAGFPLVTDDVLPLDIDDGAVSGHRSGFELRLRTTAATLIERFPSSVDRRMTSDDRRALRPTMTERRSLPLSAIVLPRPDRERPFPVATRLGVADAGLALSRCTRTEGWRDPGILRRNFSQVATLAQTVPVYAVDVPWGPPFAEDLVARVLGACALDDAGDGVAASTTAPAIPVR